MIEYINHQTYKRIKKKEELGKHGKRKTIKWDQLYEILKHYKASIIKTAWCWPIDRQIYQWNRMESPELDPSTYRNLLCDKGKIRAITPTIHKISSKWFTELNVKNETTRVLEKPDFNHGLHF